MKNSDFVNITEIDAALDRAKELMLPRTLMEGSPGAQARMSIEVSHRFSRQLAVEVNMGTSAEHVSDALAAVCSNMICDFIAGLDGADDAGFAQMPGIQRQISKTAQFIAQRLRGAAEPISNEVVPVSSCGGEA